jgi:hypothetical protein
MCAMAGLESGATVWMLKKVDSDNAAARMRRSHVEVSVVSAVVASLQIAHSVEVALK